MESTFQPLLRVQEHDTVADQLRHRRASLPELTQLASVMDSLAALEHKLADSTSRRDDAARHQAKLEDELTGLEDRIRSLEAKLYSGEVVVVRELQAMQADAEALRRRRAALEDDVLVAMETREPLDAEVASLEAEQSRLDEEATALRATIAEIQAALDVEIAAETAARDSHASGLSAEVLSLYEGLRARHGGIGAAALANGRCGGCHLSLPATELDRLKREPPDALVRCDNCGRVLVR